MGIIRLATTILATLAVSSGVAWAGEMVSAFDKDCLQAHGDQKAALAAADAAGWIKVDEKVPASMNPNFKLEDYGVRKLGSGADATTLAAGMGTLPMGGRSAPARFCMLAGNLATDDVAKLQTSLGLAPMMDMNMPGAEQAKMTMYMFRETASGRAALTTAEMAAMGKSDGSAPPAFSMVMTMDTAAHKGMLMYIAVSP